MRVVTQFATQDTTFDVCFSEGDPDKLLSAGGDSTLKLWSLKDPSKPLSVFQGHQAEVQSVEWNHLNKSKILSASNDKTVALWDMQQPQPSYQPIAKFQHDHIAN